MTARDELLAYIDRLSDDQALALWHRIQFEEAIPPEPLTPEQMASIELGMTQLKADLGVPNDELMRRLQLQHEDGLG